MQNIEQLEPIITQSIQQLEELQAAAKGYWNQPENEQLFATGAQLLYLGQALTEASGYKLEPACQEVRALLTRVVSLLEIITVKA
jgi:hypothetical protein